MNRCHYCHSRIDTPPTPPARNVFFLPELPDTEKAAPFAVCVMCGESACFEELAKEARGYRYVLVLAPQLGDPVPVLMVPAECCPHTDELLKERGWEPFRHKEGKS